MNKLEVPQGVDVLGPVTGEQTEILSPEALEFFAALQREFNPRRQRLLLQRQLRQEAIDRGEMPGFLPGPNRCARANWQVLPVPEDLRRPPRGNHRPGGPENGDQCPELRRELLHGRL